MTKKTGKEKTIFFILIISILFGCQPSELNVASKTDVAFIEETVPIDGETLFNENCSSCHLGGVPKAPHLIEFQLRMLREKSSLILLESQNAELKKESVESTKIADELDNFLLKL
mgnify:CR=1 FL=1